MEAVIFIGVQACGKSTFYRRRFGDTHVRINLDMLRTRHRERTLLAACLEARQRFVVDNTNVTADDRQRYLDLARPARFATIGYYFESKVADCLARNAGREAARRVPEAAILATHRRLEFPRAEEGFDALYYVRTDGSGGFEILEWRDEV